MSILLDYVGTPQAPSKSGPFQGQINNPIRHDLSPAKAFQPMPDRWVLVLSPQDPPSANLTLPSWLSTSLASNSSS
jgi:hypothetical protein